MTERDPIPSPTCPLCATRDRVERDRHRWLCCACWTVFTGSQDEWERTRHMRERRQGLFDVLTPKADV